MNLQFEWDAAKAASNINKHSVSFEEAVTVFRDRFALIFDDEIHSEDELREIIIGHSDTNHLLVICFTEHNEVIRIISARRVTRRERRDYEEYGNS